MVRWNLEWIYLKHLWWRGSVTWTAPLRFSRGSLRRAAALLWCEGVSSSPQAAGYVCNSVWLSADCHPAPTEAPPAARGNCTNTRTHKAADSFTANRKSLTESLMCSCESGRNRNSDVCSCKCLTAWHDGLQGQEVYTALQRIYLRSGSITKVIYTQYVTAKLLNILQPIHWSDI